MALIKCKECGHEVSDKASMCPNCGCPIAMETIVTKKSKGKLWSLLAILLCLIIGGGYAYAKLFNGGSSEGSAIVELTPEFVNAIQKYEELGSFSEGMAAVMRDGKWGYINTKGEEVIPCQFPNADYYNTASPFHEGLALIQKDGKWGFINTKGDEVIPINIEAEAVGRFSEGLAFVYKSGEDFSVIDKEGNTLFSDKCINFGEYYTDDFDESVLPFYRQGLLYVRISYDKFTVYDKQGNKTKEINQETKDELDKQEDSKPYTIFLKEFDDNEVLYTVGLKDANGTELLPAIYDEIENYGLEQYFDAPNGVVLVVLEEIGDDVFEGYAGELENTKRYYGYADLKGNDTFTDEIKQKCKKSKEDAIAKGLLDY